MQDISRFSSEKVPQAPDTRLLFFISKPKAAGTVARLSYFFIDQVAFTGIIL